MKIVSKLSLEDFWTLKKEKTSQHKTLSI